MVRGDERDRETKRASEGQRERRECGKDLYLVDSDEGYI